MQFAAKIKMCAGNGREEFYLLGFLYTVPSRVWCYYKWHVMKNKACRGNKCAEWADILKCETVKWQSKKQLLIFDWWLNVAWLCTQRQYCTYEYNWKQGLSSTKLQMLLNGWSRVCRICLKHIEINLQFAGSNCLLSRLCCHLGICSSCFMILACCETDCCPFYSWDPTERTYENWGVAWTEKSGKETMEIHNKQPQV